MEYNPNKRTNLKGVKAYRNNTFISSREARSIRVQCEVVEPGIRLERLGIEHMITFFGSARLGRENGLEDPDYHATYKLASKLGTWAREMGNIGISSGGGPGIMEATNRGAKDAGCKSIGMGISLPFEQSNNDYITEDLDFEFHYFFTRKYWCVYLSKAFVIMPGGVGTMDELFEILTLIQTHKMKPKPIVLYNSDFWSNVVNFETMIKHGTISADDVNLFKITDDIDEACEYIKDNIDLTSHPDK
tara:strand:- start:1228 stop:1965 length:738 start_codon:yes stop_codon:yes gene_type:complete